MPPSLPPSPSKSFKPSKSQVILGNLVTKVAAMPVLVNLLEHSYTSKARDQLAAALNNLLSEQSKLIIKDVYSDFFTYCRWVPLD